MDTGRPSPESRRTATGTHGGLEPCRVITYPFDRYEVKVQLTPTNVFLGIVEIKVNKDFLSSIQRASSSGDHDVEEFYREGEQEEE